MMRVKVSSSILSQAFAEVSGRTGTRSLFPFRSSSSSSSSPAFSHLIQVSSNNVMTPGTLRGRSLVVLQWQPKPDRRFLSSSSSLKDVDKRWEEYEPEGDVPYLVYDGLLKRHLKHTKIFSLMTSGLGLWMQPIIIQEAGQHGMAATVAMLSMVGIFTYVTPFLIHSLAKKYVTDIVYDPKTGLYTASTYTFFLRRKELVFHKDQVTVPDVPGPFSSVIVNTKDGKKHPLFIAPESFIYHNHYGLIMGYDKPLDLHIKDGEDIAAAVEQKVKEKKS